MAWINYLKLRQLGIKSEVRKYTYKLNSKPSKSCITTANKSEDGSLNVYDIIRLCSHVLAHVFYSCWYLLWRVPPMRLRSVQVR